MPASLAIIPGRSQSWQNHQRQRNRLKARKSSPVARGQARQLQALADLLLHLAPKSQRRRLGSILRARLRKRDKKLRGDGKTHLEASFAARDTMDFSMQGTWAAERWMHGEGKNQWTTRS